jgi:DNA-binding SARP family transcriptional activator
VIAMPLMGQRKPLIEDNSATLCLLGGPFLAKNGRRLEIPEGSQRLLVFVTLNGGQVNRRHAAGVLWPYGDDERAAGNLRSALWRLRGAGIDVLHADKCTLYLDPDLSVDIMQLSRWAMRVIDGSADASELDTSHLSPEAVDLLPGWYDDWVIFERERLRQRLLHAMESLVRRLIAHRLFADAVEVAMSAVSVEPLRESAQRVLIEAHLAEGNYVEARRVYVAYHELIAEELGIPPSNELAEILRVSASRPAQIRRIGPATASRPPPRIAGAQGTV